MVISSRYTRENSNMHYKNLTTTTIATTRKKHSHSCLLKQIHQLFFWRVFPCFVLCILFVLFFLIYIYIYIHCIFFIYFIFFRHKRKKKRNGETLWKEKFIHMHRVLTWSGSVEKKLKKTYIYISWNNKMLRSNCISTMKKQFWIVQYHHGQKILCSKRFNSTHACTGCYLYFLAW